MSEKPYRPDMFVTSDPREIAILLWSKGYRQTSRAYGHISQTASDAVIKQRLAISRINCDSPPNWSDYEYYRRCLSNNTITGVPQLIMMYIRRLGYKNVNGG